MLSSNINIARLSVITILLLVVLPYENPAQKDDLRFENISVENGLAQISVYAVCQDAKGFMWFGTQEGLQKFDGYDFKTYFVNPMDSLSLRDAWIWSIYEDLSGDLWLGTRSGGLSRFLRDKDKFKNYYHTPGQKNGIASNEIFCTVEDLSMPGILWIGTAAGLTRLDKKTEQFKNFTFRNGHEPEYYSDEILNIYASPDRSGILWLSTRNGLIKFNVSTEEHWHYFNKNAAGEIKRDNTVRVVQSGPKGRLWVGTRGGLYIFDPKTEIFNRDFPGRAPDVFYNSDVYELFLDQKGDLWIGFTKKGLYKFSSGEQTYIPYLPDRSNKFSIEGTGIMKLFEDRAGVIWVGTEDAGLNKYSRWSDKFIHYRNIPSQKNTLSHSFIWSIAEDEDGYIWIGTVDGLNRFDRETGEFRVYKSSSSGSSISNNVIRSIHVDSRNRIWTGTDNGLNLLKPDGSFENYYFFGNDPRCNKLFTVYESASDPGVLWLGTERCGLIKFDTRTGEYTGFTEEDGLSDNTVVYIYEDKFSDLWVGTFEGLSKIDVESALISNYKIDFEGHYPDEILVIHEDKKNNLWVGASIGLFQFDRVEKKFTYYNESLGFYQKVVYGLLEDDNGNLWISTNDGLYKYDPVNKKSVRFGISDGLQNREFNAGAFTETRDGMMVFGGPGGFNMFDPGNIKTNPVPPPIEITGLEVLNKEVNVNFEGDGILKKNITVAEEIHLSYDDYIITIEFAALDYSQPKMNNYKYKLEGFDRAWNEIGNAHRSATYTNLPGGEYTFRVTGSNGDNVWNTNGASLKIVVHPPFWDTALFKHGAFTLGILIAAGLLFIYFRKNRKKKTELQSLVNLKTMQVQEKNDLLDELRIMQRELLKAKESAEENSRIKSSLLANLSHEFRTPLMGILGYARLLQSELAEGDHKEYARKIKISGDRLLNALSAILKISQLETIKNQLEPVPVDLTEVASRVVNQYLPDAKEKGLELTIHSDSEGLGVKGDKELSRLVVANLVDNAVKFTKEGRIRLEIYVQRTDGEKKLVLKVSDTGIGVADKHREMIFHEFRQVSEGWSRSFEGSGLGLSIVEKIVNLFDGEIKVESEVGEGTDFYIYFNPVELTREPEISDVVSVEEKVEEHHANKRILLVEDNAMNRDIIELYLRKTGNLDIAGTAREAILKCTENDYDLLLVDINLGAGRSGADAVKEIRKLENYRDKPVVAVTGYAMAGDKEELLRSGFDHYLPKPFSRKEILSIVNQVLV